MKNIKHFLALFMAVVMTLSCFATLSLGVVAEENDAAEVLLEESTALMYEYNFGKYSDDVSAVFDLERNVNVSFTKETHSGYVTFTSDGGDHYVVFKDAPALASSLLDYVVIKYRATASATGDMFVARTDNVGWGGNGSNVKLDFVGDGQWHTLTVDASAVWGNVTDVQLTDIRFDPLDNAAGQFDLAYIKFFATAEGAAAQVAAETANVHVTGELPASSDKVVQVGGAYYTAETMIPLTVMENGAVDVKFEGKPSKLSICCDAIYIKMAGADEVTVVDQVANVYLRDEMGGQIIDADGTMEYFSLYGWVNPLDTSIAMAAFGYQLNDQEPVFDSSWVYNDTDLYAPVSEYARRFKNITVDTSDLPAGTYNVYPLLKTPEGVIYHLATWGSMQFIKGGEESGAYRDADGNVYTVRGNYLYKGSQDTGLTVLTDDNGKTVAYDHAIPLTYVSAENSAIEINGTKYIYANKVAVSPVREPIDPADNSSANQTYDSTAAHVSMDTIYFGDNADNYVASGLAIGDYLTANDGLIRDTDGKEQALNLRGWVGHNESPVAQFGYAINGGEPVWGEFKQLTESAVQTAGGGANAQRYCIVIPVGELANNAMYRINLLVKYEDGSIVTLNHSTAPTAPVCWGDNLRYVKGGSWKTIAYTVGKDTYKVVENGVTKNDTLIENAMITELGGEMYFLDGVAELSAAGDAGSKYVFDTDISYIKTPAIPLDPAKVVPVYIVDGEDLVTVDGSNADSSSYNYEGGYVTYTSVGDDPNVTPYIVPAGTVVGPFMAMKYRTTDAVADGVFIGQGAGAMGPDHVKYPEYIQDGEWHTFVVDLRVSKDYDVEGNVVNHGRHDIMNDAGQSIDVEYIAFFNTREEAEFYASENLHVLPKAPVWYTATFKADGQVVSEVKFLEGSTSIKAPAVPAKEGYTGEWEAYTVTDTNFTVNAVYTVIPAEKLVINDPSIIDRFSLSEYGNYITANQADIVYNQDGSVTFNGTWTEEDTLDPFFTLKYSNLMRKAWVDFTRPNQVPNANGEYSVLVFKVKIDASVAGNSMLYYCTQGGAIDGTLTEYPIIDATGTGDVEYIVFDMGSYSDFANMPLGDIRLDWVEASINNTVASAENVGASITLYEIRMFKDMAEAAAACGFEYEEETKKPTSTETKAEETTPDAGEETQAPADDKGCASVVTVGTLAVLMSGIAAAYVLKKREE